MNISKTGNRGKWIIDGKYSAELTKCDDQRSRVELHWYRTEKDINSRGRIVEVSREMTDNFIVNGRGRKAAENVAKLIEGGCFRE